MSPPFRTILNYSKILELTDNYTSEDLAKIIQCPTELVKMWQGGATLGNMPPRTYVSMAAFHMGMGLYGSQNKCLKDIENTIVVTAVGQHDSSELSLSTTVIVPFTITGQKIADIGRPYSVTGGVATKMYEVKIPLEGRVLTATYDKLLSAYREEQAAALVYRELAVQQTGWELTKTKQILDFVVKAPSLMTITSAIHKDKPAPEKIRLTLKLLEITYGCGNFYNAGLKELIETAKQSVARPVLVIPKTAFRAIFDQLDSIFEVRRIPLQSPEGSLVTYRAEPSTRDLQPNTYHMDFLPANGNARKLRNLDAGETIPALVSKDGDLIPIVVVDNMQIDDETSMESPFVQRDAMRFEYFTVGSVASIVNSIKPELVFSNQKDSKNGEFSTDKLALRSPSVSYVHDYTDGSCKPVTLVEAHQSANPEFMFTEDRQRELALRMDTVIGTANVLYNDEAIMKMMRAGSFREALQLPQSHFETDMRHMIRPQVGVDEKGDNVLLPDERRAVITAARWVHFAGDYTLTGSEVHEPEPEGNHDDIYQPNANMEFVYRGALYNASPLQSIKSEIIQVGAELTELYDSTDDLKAVIVDLKEWLARPYEEVDFLQAKTRRLTSEEEQDALLRDGRLGPGMADPLTIVVMKRRMRAILIRNNADEIVVLNKALTVYNTISKLAKDILGDGGTRSILGILPVNTYDLQQPTAGEMLFMRVMFYCVLPVISTKVVTVKMWHMNRYTLGGIPVYGRTLCTLLLPNNHMFLIGNTDENSNLFVDVTEHMPFFLADRYPVERESIITRMWTERYRALRQCSSYNCAVLMGIHYSLMMNYDNFQKVFDRKNYSGLAYVGVRMINFDSYSATVVPTNSVIHITGRVTATALEHRHQLQITTYKEAGCVPSGLKTGMGLRNIYISNVRGGRTKARDETDILFVDSFNSYSPADYSCTSEQSNFLLFGGRSDFEKDPSKPDPLTGLFTCMPTLTVAGAATHNVEKLIDDYVTATGGESAFLDTFNQLIKTPTLEEFVLLSDLFDNPAKFIVDCVHGGRNWEDGRFYSPRLPVLFCATYGIGRLSDRQINNPCPTVQLNNLCPRVNGTGIFANSTGKVAAAAVQTVLTRCLGGAGARGWLTA